MMVLGYFHHNPLSVSGGPFTLLLGGGEVGSEGGEGGELWYYCWNGVKGEAPAGLGRGWHVKRYRGFSLLLLWTYLEKEWA